MAYYEERWAPYVPVAERRAQAAREAKKLMKKGQQLRPIRIQGRAIATSFWGKAWCDNLEKYADWSNRLPRGRTYARNGSILDLQISKGNVEAVVSGSSIYKIKLTIASLEAAKWASIRLECTSQVRSLLDLMRGKLPEAVLRLLTDPSRGMFPNPKELKMQCSCPDYATMCKHVAATLYGVGHLLDTEPELFFLMRGVDRLELVSEALTTQMTDDAIGLNQESEFANEDLNALFGIELASPQTVLTSSKSPGRKTKATKAKSSRATAVKAKPTTVKKPVKEKAAKTKAVKAKAVKPESTKAKVVKSQEESEVAIESLVGNFLQSLGTQLRSQSKTASNKAVKKKVARKRGT